MADQHADTAEHAYAHGEMEISEQVSTWHLFVFLAKWGSLLTASVMLLLVLWFAVGAGFIAAAISAVALFVVGFFALRSKPAQH